MSQCTIGLDIGGTTYSSSLFDEKLNIIYKSKKELISDSPTIELLLDSLCKQLSHILDNNSNIVGIGVACPGPLDSKNGIILDTPNLKILQNINLKKELESRLHLPICIDNDANLFALGEWFLSGGNDDEILGGITLGTGLGFGIIINGKIYSGAHGLAAEYAISPIDKGNWESKVSIKAIEKISQKYFENQRLNPKDLFEMAERGDSNAISIWKEFGANLGLPLSHFINLIDPHKILIGGGISNAFKFFNESMIDTIKKHSPSYNNFKIEISESSYKELSSQLGAAVLVKGYNKEK